MRRKRSEKRNYASLNFVLYVLLLIMTPFILLQNYLQAAIGVASNSKLDLGGFSIPWVIIIALSLFAILLICVRKQIKWRHLGVLCVMLFLYWSGQQVTDFYLNHKFYELQHNWHYLAYWGFAIVSWRFWKSRGKTASQTILNNLILAFSVSLLDEIAQVPLSNRVFDVCDIAKDIYGAVIGNIFVFYILEDGKSMKGRFKLVFPRIKDYLENPLTLLIYEYIFVYIFLIFTSTLSSSEYIPISMLIPTGIFIVVWFLIYLLQYKISRILVILLVGLAVLGQIISYTMYHDKNINLNRHGLTIYRGIPIPYFDIMIFENGRFRLVDKKHSFNIRDQRTLASYTSDILLIGSGSEGKGGKGFTEPEAVQFRYNPNTGKMFQIIILRTPEACRVFNRLKEEGKNVTFIIHNTC